MELNGIPETSARAKLRKLSDRAVPIRPPSTALACPPSTEASCVSASKRRVGGQCAPWSERRQEAMSKLEHLFPTVVFNREYYDETKWRRFVQGKNSKVMGQCQQCQTNVCASLHNLLTSGQGFKNCRCNPLAKDHITQERRLDRRIEPAGRPRISTAIDAEQREAGGATTSPRAAALDSDDVNDANASSAPAERAVMRGLQGSWALRFNDFQQLMGERFSHIQLDDRFAREELWASSLGKTPTMAKITGTCGVCGVPVSALLLNLVKAQYQGFGTAAGVPCKCHIKAVAFNKARLRLPDHQKLLRIELQETTNRKKVQNCSFAVTHCSQCGMQCRTQVKVLLSTRGPACQCSNMASWAGEDGYTRMMSLLSKHADTRHYEAAFDMKWWMTNVMSANTQVPLRCTICSQTVRNIRISNIQQGTSVGCNCQLHGQSSLAAFLVELFPQAPARQEVPVVRNPATGRELRGDFALLKTIETRDAELSHICDVLELDSESAHVKHIVLELDGDAHFYLERVKNLKRRTCVYNLRNTLQARSDQRRNECAIQRNQCAFGSCDAVAS